nr:hypothetical protein [Tanacetum cinerariifolium]
VETIGSPSSTTVDQDAPSPSKSQTTPKTQPPVIPHDVEEHNHDIEVVHMGNDLLFGMPILEVASDQSLSTDSMLFPKIGSTTLRDKVIVTLSNLNVTIGKLSSLEVGTYSGSGNSSLVVGMP